MTDQAHSKPAWKDSISAIYKRPIGLLFVGMFLFGLFLMAAGDTNILHMLHECPVYGVFIIPSLVGMIMLVMTKDEVTRIHDRFDTIEKKLDKLDTIEGVLNEIRDILKAHFEQSDRNKN